MSSWMPGTVRKIVFEIIGVGEEWW